MFKMRSRRRKESGSCRLPWSMSALVAAIYIHVYIYIYIYEAGTLWCPDFGIFYVEKGALTCTRVRVLKHRCSGAGDNTIS